LQKIIKIELTNVDNLIKFPMNLNTRILKMKKRSSLKSAKARDKNCKLVKRGSSIFVINKKNPKMKAKQG